MQSITLEDSALDRYCADIKNIKVNFDQIGGLICT